MDGRFDRGHGGINMASKAEQRTSELLRELLKALPDGVDVVESKLLQGVLNGLEFFIPEVLREIYPYWKYESLDGIIPLTTKKASDREIEIFGLCIIISDQTLTPIHLQLQIADAVDEVTWLECRLGETSGDGMLRSPYRSRIKALNALQGRKDDINWVYKATFGDRTSSTPQ
jgi:hypothetical protein